MTNKPAEIDPVVPDPAVVALTEQVGQLQQRVNGLEPIVRFTSLRNQMRDKTFDERVSHLSESVQTLRTRGYKFEESLEQTSKALTEQWETLHPQLSQKLEEQAVLLKPDLYSVTSLMMELNESVNNPQRGKPLLAHAQIAVDDLESRSELAMAEINEPFTAYQAKLDKFLARLHNIETTLALVDGAKFQPNPDESAVIAAQAAWVRTEEDHPEGILYLTNQRILFEQRQEVATAKFLFITTESKLVHEILLNVTVDKILEAQVVSEGGGFLHPPEDHLVVTFKTGTPVPKVDFQLPDQLVALWQSLITQICTGSFA